MRTTLKVPTRKEYRDKQRTEENVMRELNGYTIAESEGILQSDMYHIHRAATVREDGYLVEE